MAVMGDLKDFGVAGMLHILGMQRATGQLRIIAEGDEVALYLKDGQLLLVSSYRLPLRLGRVLQQRGLVSLRQLHEALRQQEREGYRQSLGAILIERGWLMPADLSRCVEEQAVGILSRVMAAGQGTFAYNPGVQVPPGVATFPLDAQRLLFESTKRVDELGALRAQFPHRFAPLAPSAHVDVTVAAMTPLEEQILHTLRAGASSLAELEELLPLEEGTLMRTLIGMRNRGLIVAGEGAPGSEIGVPGAPPPTEDDLAGLLDARTAAADPSRPAS